MFTVLLAAAVLFAAETPAAPSIGAPPVAAPPTVPQTPPAGRPSIITRPTYARVPTGYEMARYYPSLASVIGVEGRVTLFCRISADGRLEACEVEKESPPALGFGEAAIQVSALIRMKPATVDGVAIDGGSVRVPILFAMPDRPLPDLKATLYCYGMLHAYSASRPGERRLAVASDRARFRAEHLMTEAGLTPARIDRRLADAVAEGQSRPVHHPGKPNDVDDKCLRVFLA